MSNVHSPLLSSFFPISPFYAKIEKTRWSEADDEPVGNRGGPAVGGAGSVGDGAEVGAAGDWGDGAEVVFWEVKSVIIR